jgi:hypothetical protein
MKRNGIIALVILAVLAGGALGVKRAVDAQRPSGTDDDQLREILYEGERAAERLDAGGIVHYISPNYQDNLGMNAARMNYQIRRYLSQRKSLDVTIPAESVHTQIAPDGKTGAVSFHVQVNSQGGGAGSADWNLTLKTAKERVYYFWVFPGEEWRITSAEGYTALEE